MDHTLRLMMAGFDVAAMEVARRSARELRPDDPARDLSARGDDSRGQFGTRLGGDRQVQ